MLRTLILVATLSATGAFAQLPNLNAPQISTESDTTLKVIYADQAKAAPGPAWFLNEKLVSHSLLESLNPNMIDDIEVIKGSFQVNNVDYNGQVRVKTKNNYAPQIISLTDLKKKYTNLKDGPTVFLINDNFVKTSYDQYTVDEKAITTILIDTIKNTADKIDLQVIKVSTKPRKPGEIKIRGTELGMNH